jgi:hypothetical protein
MLTAEEEWCSSEYLIEGEVIPGVRAVADSETKQVIIGPTPFN